MKKKLMCVDTLFDQINTLDNEFLYTKTNYVQIHEEVLIVYEDEYTVPDEEIDGFKYRLVIYQIKDVMENLEMQLANPSLEKYIEAVNFFIDNDAYLDTTSNARSQPSLDGVKNNTKKN